jgi:glutathione S-transferase
MLTIYGVYRSRASRNIWLAGELGIPFKHVPVIQAYRVSNPNAANGPLHTRSAEFLKINPSGHVPSIDDDGLILHESLAINLYLAKKHGGPLAPADVAEDGQMSMWALWAATEVEPHALALLNHRVAKPPQERDAKLAQAALEALRAPFAVLDRALTASGYLVGGRFTVADINMAEVCRYAMAAPELFEAAPSVQKWLAACHARPAFRAMMAKREAEPAKPGMSARVSNRSEVASSPRRRRSTHGSMAHRMPTSILGMDAHLRGHHF